MQVITISRAAETLGFSETTIRRLIKNGELPAYRIGGSIRVRPEDLDLAYHRIRPASSSHSGNAA